MQTRELQLAVWTRRRRRRDDRSKPLCYRRFTRAKLSNRLVVRTTPDLLPGENGDVRPQRWSEAAPPGLSSELPTAVLPLQRRTKDRTVAGASADGWTVHRVSLGQSCATFTCVADTAYQRTDQESPMAGTHSERLRFDGKYDASDKAIDRVMRSESVHTTADAS